MVEAEVAAEGAGGISSEVEVAFDDMTVLSEQGIDVFVLAWTQDETPPPFYVTVAERRFTFSSTTFLVRGHGAQLAEYVREQEGEQRTVLLVERDGRYLIYLHDAAAPAEDGDEGGDDEGAAEGDSA